MKPLGVALSAWRAQAVRIGRAWWRPAALACLPLALAGLFALLVPVARHGQVTMSYTGRMREVVLLLGGAATALGLAGVAVARACQRRGVAQGRMAAQREIARFRRSLDHELRNPLAAIQGGLDHLAPAELSDEYRHTLAILGEQTNQLTHIVTSLRKLSELERLEPEREPVDVHALLQRLHEAATAHPLARHRSLKLVIPEAWPLPPVLGDEDLLFLALYNLVDNAIKFTAEGQMVEIMAWRHEAALIIEIADNGMGIPADCLDYIWEPLYRGANARGIPGSGLGLPLVRAILDIHGGQARVQSEVGQGTLFRIVLPIA